MTENQNVWPVNGSCKITVSGPCISLLEVINIIMLVPISYILRNLSLTTSAQRSPRDMTSGKSMPVHKARRNNQIFKVYSRTPKESYGGHELAWKTTREIKLRIYTGIDSHVVPKPPASVNISTCKPGIFKGHFKMHITCSIFEHMRHKVNRERV